MTQSAAPGPPPPPPPTHQAARGRRPGAGRAVLASGLGLIAAVLLALSTVLTVAAVVVADSDRPGRLLVVVVEVPALRADIADALAADIADEARTSPGAPTIDERSLSEAIGEVLASDDLRSALLELRKVDDRIDLSPVQDVVADAVAESDDSIYLQSTARQLRADEEVLDGADLTDALVVARVLALVLALVVAVIGLVFLGLTALAARRTLVGFAATLAASGAVSLLLLHPIEPLVPGGGPLRHLADVGRSVGTLADPATSIVLGLAVLAASALATRGALRRPRVGA